MKSKYIITALSFAAFALVGSSCQKFLDITPKDEVPEEKIFENYDGYQGALISCYNTLRRSNLYGKNLMYTSIETLANNWNKPSEVNQRDQLDLYNHDYSGKPARDFAAKVYNEFFNAIVQANNLLKHKGEAIQNPSDRALILGEAHAIRALCYFELLRLFGPIPGQPGDSKLIYSYTDSYKANYIELSYQEYVEKLSEEFKTAAALLVESDPVKIYSYDQLNNAGAKGYENVKVEDQFMLHRQLRLNYWALRALEARFALYVGDNDKAHDIAMEIINARASDGTPIVSLSTLSDVDKQYFSSPSEALFMLSIKDLNNQTLQTLGGSATSTIESTQSFWQHADVIKDRIFQNSHLTEDVRYKNLWEFESKDASGSKYPTIKKFFYRDPVNANSGNETGTIQLKKSVVPVIRLSEVYLIAIETSKDLSEVNRLYKEYMKSKNIIVDKDVFSSLSETQKQIPHEYIREFMAEGVMFYVYKRRNAQQFLLTDKKISEHAYTLPNPDLKDKKQDQQ